jgi:hypothetical protein
MDRDFTISPSQGIQLLSIADLLKHGAIEIRGDGEGPDNARKAIMDVAQEIALQVEP